MFSTALTISLDPLGSNARSVLQDAIGTSLVLIGIVVVASFADKESGCYTIHELVALYREPLFIVYALLMALAASSLYAFSKRMERIKAKHGTSSPEYKRFRKVHSFSMLMLC